MQEHQRQQILQAMGVAVLQPRFVFAGAKASKLIESGKAITAQQAPKLSESLQPEPASQEKVDAASEAPLKSLKDIVAIGTAQKQEPQKNIAKASTMRFRHRIVAFESMLFVVDQPELQWHQSDKKLRFMQDICQAVFTKSCLEVKQDTFSWPIAGIDDCHAKATEQAFIMALAKQCQAQAVVLFSKQLAPLLVDGETMGGMPAIVVEPIEHYWQNPAAKASLWQSLQVLR